MRRALAKCEAIFRLYWGRARRLARNRVLRVAGAFRCHGLLGAQQRSDAKAVVQAHYASQLSDAAAKWLLDGGVITPEQRTDVGQYSAGSAIGVYFEDETGRRAAAHLLTLALHVFAPPHKKVGQLGDVDGNASRLVVSIELTRRPGWWMCWCLTNSPYSKHCASVVPCHVLTRRIGADNGIY